MPNVISYTPAWLSNPAPGSTIFAPTIPKSSSNTSVPYQSLEASKRNAKPGPRRTIAQRGTEVFTAVGKEIRWADLAYLKEAWEENQEDGDDEERPQGFRV